MSNPIFFTVFKYLNMKYKIEQSSINNDEFKELKKLARIFQQRS